MNNKYLIKSDGKESSTDNIAEAEKLLGAYRTEFQFPGNSPERFDFYIEAEIDYVSALEIDLPGRSLWNYFIPSKKIQNIRLK